MKIRHPVFLAEDVAITSFKYGDEAPCTLYVMVGYPASGKTTYARSLDALRVSMDDIWRMMGDEFDVNMIDFYHQYEDLIVHDLLSQQHSVVIDRCNVSADLRRHWVDISRRQGADCVAIVIETDERVYRERNSKRDDPVTDAMYKTYKADWQYPSEQEGFVEVRRIAHVRNQVISEPGKEDLHFS